MHARNPAAKATAEKALSEGNGEGGLRRKSVKGTARSVQAAIKHAMTMTPPLPRL